MYEVIIEWGDKMALSNKTFWRISITLIIAGFILAIISRCIFQGYKVEGPSMQPTLTNGDLVIVNTLSYAIGVPERGDILVFHYTSNPRRVFIKRAIAVPGDTIEIKNGGVFINGEKQKETYILEPTMDSYPLATVPPNYIFVLGDNRNNSEDSRYTDVGFVPYDLIIGKKMLVIKNHANDTGKN